MKTLLSIGAGAGIGYATAERFARDGYRIVLAARDLERVSQLAERLQASGYVAQARTSDATDPAQLTALVAAVIAEAGTIDVLHYNAASLRQADLAAQPSESFNSDLAVNIGGALAAAQAALPAMAARATGTIQLTGGHFGVQPNADYLSLSIGKAGIRALALALFEPAKAVGVHVATVTVAANVTPESKEARGIAEAFWTLHKQPRDAWTSELTYAPE